jgi:hypothetical protein
VKTDEEFNAEVTCSGRLDCVRDVGLMIGSCLRFLLLAYMLMSSKNYSSGANLYLVSVFHMSSLL